MEDDREETGQSPKQVGNTASRSSFLEELQRHEVLKAAGIYAGGAWLLTEILLAVLDRSPVTESLRALSGCVIVSVFIAGFPVAVILAWFFDLTRKGVLHETTSARGNLATALIAMVMVVAATALLMWRVNPCGLGRVLGVAMLPCSYYGAAGFEHQAAGISEELNYRLSHLKQLRVPAWRSTTHFAAKVVDPLELSESLGADRLVECGMRRSEERISINLQLFDADADRNLWAEEYQGQTSDELLLISDAFRDLIGVDALNISARAGGRIERVNEAPTASSEAWILFQRGRAAGNDGDPGAAAIHFRQAAGLDPSFARAHAAVGRQYWLDSQADGLTQKDRTARLNAAWAHTQRALNESPRLADALAIRRVLLAAGVGPSPGPESEPLPTDQDQLHEMIIDLRPSFAEEFVWWATWLDAQGQESEADRARDTARRLDPAAVSERASTSR